MHPKAAAPYLGGAAFCVFVGYAMLAYPSLIPAGSSFFVLVVLGASAVLLACAELLALFGKLPDGWSESSGRAP